MPQNPIQLPTAAKGSELPDSPWTKSTLTNVMIPLLLEQGLKALRLSLEQRTGFDLSGYRVHIRRVAEQAVETVMTVMSSTFVSVA